MFADVYFKNGHAYCQLCEGESCEHIDYALSLKKVQELLRQKGWIIEEGNVAKKPY